MGHRNPRRGGEHERRTEQTPGPSPDDIKEALEAILAHEVPGTPRVTHLRTLEAAGIGAPLEVGPRVIKAWSIQRGKTGRGNGHLRSDDHVATYEVEFRRRCPECDYSHARFDYTTNHHIAGRQRCYCPNCEYTHEQDSWG